MIEACLLMPVQLCDGSVWLFHKEVKLPMAPYPGLYIDLDGDPDSKKLLSRDRRLVVAVTIHTETNEISCDLDGMVETTYNRDEMLIELGVGWGYDSQPLQAAAGAQPVDPDPEGEAADPWI